MPLPNLFNSSTAWSQAFTSRDDMYTFAPFRTKPVSWHSIISHVLGTKAANQVSGGEQDHTFGNHAANALSTSCHEHNLVTNIEKIGDLHNVCLAG